MSSMVTLKDGSQISQGTLVYIRMNIVNASQGSQVVLYDLLMRSKDPKYISLFGDTTGILKEYRLLDGNGMVPDDVKRVALCSIEGKFPDVQIVNPFYKRRITN